MNKYSTADRLKQIMNERSLRQVDILEAAKPFCEKFGVKLGKNNLSQYVSGKVEPGQYKLSILGMALNVSEAWLMGYDLPASRKEMYVNIDNDLDAEASQLFSHLSGEKKAEVLAYMHALMDNDEDT